MLRADNCICGTITTGTGTLTLAACPTGVGGVDPFVAFGGMGLGTTVGTPIGYDIIEYTDATFTNLKQRATHWGLLTLGANIGACTLTRNPYVTSTGLDAGSPTYSEGNGAGGAATIADISIGVAANTLIVFGDSAVGDSAPWWDTSSQGVDHGIYPLGTPLYRTSVPLNTSGTANFLLPFRLPISLMVRRGYIEALTGYSGGTPVSNAWMRIYAHGANGRPAKRLVDLGLLGTAGASLNTAAPIGTALAPAGGMLKKGALYWAEIVYSVSGSPTTAAALSGYEGFYAQNQTYSGTNDYDPFQDGVMYATSTPTTGTAPDPASLTGFAYFDNPAANIPRLMLAST